MHKSYTNAHILDMLRKELKDLELTYEGKKTEYQYFIAGNRAVVRNLKLRIARHEAKLDINADDLIPYEDFEAWKALHPQRQHEDKQVWFNRVADERNIAHGRPERFTAAPIDVESLINHVPRQGAGDAPVREPATAEKIAAARAEFAASKE